MAGAESPPCSWSSGPDSAASRRLPRPAAGAGSGLTVVVDRSNHHLFQPLLYQVATAALSPADIAAPIRRIFRGQKNVAVTLADAVSVDVEGRRVVLADGAV